MIKHSRWLLGAILLVAGLTYILRNPQYRTGSFNDDAIYVIGARDFWKAAVDRSPLLMRDYPFPGLPLLFSPFTAFVTTQWIALEWVTVCVTLLLVWVTYGFSRRWFTMGESLSIAALIALNPLIARLSGAVMASNYYALTVIGCCWAMSTGLERPRWERSLLLGFLAGWGSLIRTEGVVLMVAVLGGLMISQKGRKMLPGVCLSLSGWGLFAFYWFRIRTFPGTDYVSDLQALVVYWQNHFVEGLSFAETCLRVFVNHALWSLPPTSGILVHLNLPLAAMIFAVAGTGFYALWQERPQSRPVFFAVLIYLGLYSAIHLFWHAAAPRYGIATLPFMVFFLVRGSRVILPAETPWHRLRPALLVLFLVGYTYQNAMAIREVFTGPNPTNVPPWKTLTWLKKTLPSEARVMSNIAPTIELYSQLPVSPGKDNDNIDFLLGGFLRSGVSHLVIRTGSFLTPAVGTVQDQNKIWARMRARVVRYPKRFEVVFADPVEETLVIRITDGTSYHRAYDLFTQATVDYRADRMAEAERGFRQVLKLYPDFGSAHNYIGAIAINRQQPAEAGMHFLRASELLPDDPHVMANVATLYRMADDLLHADEYLRRAQEASVANGTSDLWAQNIQSLRDSWDQKRIRLFLTAPSES